MKKLKKITAILLSVLMVLSMSVSAFAADVNSWWNTSLGPREVEGEDIVYIGMYNYFELQNDNNPVTVVGKTVYSGGNMKGGWGWANDSTIFISPTNESTASFTHTDDNGVQTVLNVRAVNPHYSLVNYNNFDKEYLSRVGIDTEDDIVELVKGESIVVSLVFEDGWENMGRIKDDGSIRQHLTSSDENVVSIEMGHLDSGNTFWNATLTAVGEAGEVSYVRYQNGPIDWTFAVKVVDEDGSEPAAPAYTWYMSNNNTIPESASVEAGEKLRLHIAPLVDGAADMANVIEPNRECVTVLDASGNDVTSKFDISTSNSNGYPCLRVSPSQEVYGDFTIVYEDVVSGIDLSLPLYVEAYVAPLTEGYAWVDENGNEITTINAVIGKPVTVGFKNLETGEIVRVSGSSHNTSSDHYTRERNKETNFTTYTFHTNVFDDGSNVFEVVALEANGVKVEFPLTFVVSEAGNEPAAPTHTWYMSNNNTIPENASVEAGEAIRLHIAPLVDGAADMANVIGPNRECVTVLDASGNDVTSKFDISTGKSNGYPCLRVSPSQEVYGDFTVIYEDVESGINLSLPLYVEAYVAPLTEGYAWVDENGNEITTINVVVGEPVAVGFKNLETGEIVRVSGSSHSASGDHFTHEIDEETKFTIYTFHTNVFNDGSNVFEVVALSADGVKVEFPLTFVVSEKADTVAGDTNGDNQVNSADVNLLFRAVMGYAEEAELAAADVNGDNQVNSADVNLLYRAVMGYVKP